MKIHFFRRKGVLFIPIHIIGWLFLLAVLAAGTYVIIDIASRPDTLGDIIVNSLIYVFVMVFGYMFFAFFTCKPEKEEFR